MVASGTGRSLFAFVGMVMTWGKLNSVCPGAPWRPALLRESSGDWPAGPAVRTSGTDLTASSVLLLGPGGEGHPLAQTGPGADSLGRHPDAAEKRHVSEQEAVCVVTRYREAHITGSWREAAHAAAPHAVAWVAPFRVPVCGGALTHITRNTGPPGSAAHTAALVVLQLSLEKQGTNT